MALNCSDPAAEPMSPSSMLTARTCKGGDIKACSTRRGRPTAPGSPTPHRGSRLGVAAEKPDKSAVRIVLATANPDWSDTRAVVIEREGKLHRTAQPK